jgi:hypothetical protein
MTRGKIYGFAHKQVRSPCCSVRQRLGSVVYYIVARLSVTATRLWLLIV